MRQFDERLFEGWLRQTAANFDYPAAPDLRDAVVPDNARGGRRSSLHLQPLWALVTLAVLAGLLLLVPQVRASVVSLLRAGGITVFISEPTPTAAVTRQAVSEPTASTAAATRSFLLPVTPVALEEARSYFDDSSNLLSYSGEWGSAHEAYVDVAGYARTVVLVWQDGPTARYTLYALEGAQLALKQAESATPVTVRGADAVWVEGPHGFTWQEGNVWDWQAVDGGVLVWPEGGLTYRLEGAGSLEEAEAFVASLRDEP